MDGRFLCGFFISPDGYLLTTYDLARDAIRIKVIDISRQEYRAVIIAIDEKEFPYLIFGDSDKVKDGDWILQVASRDDHNLLTMYVDEKKSVSTKVGSTGCLKMVDKMFLVCYFGCGNFKKGAKMNITIPKIDENFFNKKLLTYLLGGLYNEK